MVDIDVIDYNDAVFLVSRSENDHKYFLRDITSFGAAIWSRHSRNGLVFSSYEETSEFLEGENLHPSVEIDCLSVERWLTEEDEV